MGPPASYSLNQLAEGLGAELQGGDPDLEISGIASLGSAESRQLSFFSNRRYESDLAATRAGAVLIAREHAGLCPVPRLIAADPYLQYARCSQWFRPQQPSGPGIHASAVVAEDAEIAASASIGPHVTVGSAAVVGPEVVLGAGVSLAAAVRVGRGSRLCSNVSIGTRVDIGERCLVHSGAVLGCDGFGFAPGPEHWEKIAQLGSVSIADDVEVGACCTIDAGALENTVLARGVKLDNHVHIGHNVHIGENTVILAGTVIGGSSRIGARCRISGNASLANGISLVDDVTIGPVATVLQNVSEAGRYDSSPRLMPYGKWLRNYHWGVRLQELFRRLRALEDKTGA